MARDYFAAVNDFLSCAVDDPCLVCGNVRYFYQRSKRVVDEHPLRFRFCNGTSVVDVFRSPRFLHLAASQGFYKRCVIEKHQLRFSESVVPIFEDAHFTAKYLCEAPNKFAAFLPHAHYFYTKRPDESSLVASAWNKPSRYDELLRHGYLDILRFARERYGFVPKYVQNLVMYDLSWLFMRLVDRDHLLNMLGPSGIERFVQLLRQILELIDTETVVQYDITELPDHCKCGIIETMMGRRTFDARVRAESYEKESALARLSYTFTTDCTATFIVDSVPTAPESYKTQTHTFAGRFFASQRHVRLRIPQGGNIEAQFNETPTPLWLGRSRLARVSPAQIATENRLESLRSRAGFVPTWVEPLRSLATQAWIRRKYENAWLLMDRDVQADDNAEHLYRHILGKHPEIRAYFVLRRDSHDWQRLRHEGFNLIAFGSLPHKLAFLNCRLLASSHIDGYIVNFLPRKWFVDLVSHKFVFLQHGVTVGDISSWINQKHVDCILAAGQPEWEAFVSEGSRYRYSKQEVRLTGFPRFDSLARPYRTREKIVLFVPTWREYVVGNVKGKSNRRTLREGFGRTHYAQCWRRLLSSDRLHAIARHNGYRLVFFPHANIAPYLQEFRLPPVVQVRTHRDGGVQEALASATVLVTDYSSVAFDAAFLRRAIVYYQFDKSEFYSGHHLYSHGYFDYERDGFGPCCADEPQTLDALDRLLHDGGTPEPQYVERMEGFFPCRDDKNCERVLQSIHDLLAGRY